VGIYISHRGMRVDVCPAVSLCIYISHRLTAWAGHAHTHVCMSMRIRMYMRARAHCMSHFFLFFISSCRSARGSAKELKERRDTVCGHVFPSNSTHPRNHPTPTTPPSPHTLGRNRPRVLLKKNSTLLSLARYSIYLLYQYKCTSTDTEALPCQ
jgi:hypothetical protein